MYSASYKKLKPVPQLKKVTILLEMTNIDIFDTYLASGFFDGDGSFRVEDAPEEEVVKVGTNSGSELDFVEARSFLGCH